MIKMIFGGGLGNQMFQYAFLLDVYKRQGNDCGQCKKTEYFDCT